MCQAMIDTRFPNFHHRGMPRLTAWSKFSVNGVAVDPGPMLGEPILESRLDLLVRIYPPPTSLFPLGAHGGCFLNIAESGAAFGRGRRSVANAEPEGGKCCRSSLAAYSCCLLPCWFASMASSCILSFIRKEILRGADPLRMAGHQSALTSCKRQSYLAAGNDSPKTSASPFSLPSYQAPDQLLAYESMPRSVDEGRLFILYHFPSAQHPHHAVLGRAQARAPHSEFHRTVGLLLTFRILLTF